MNAAIATKLNVPSYADRINELNNAPFNALIKSTGYYTGVGEFFYSGEYFGRKIRIEKAGSQWDFWGRSLLTEISNNPWVCTISLSGASDIVVESETAEKAFWTAVDRIYGGRD
jgi:hypothetical protein